MDPNRQRELEASLRRELSRQAEERRLEPRAQVVWLVDQLENYVERWVGLCAASSRTESPDSDDLFQMVHIAAEVLSSKLKGLQFPEVAENWGEFLAALADARLAYDPPTRQQLAEKLAVVRSTLEDSSCRPSSYFAWDN
jgi:hypothetical protein